ncbi:MULTISPECIES: hypothetical protein [Cysteiniphilum]|uniref:hypothetical protein n=1 Tax=Cysteiniphilum TaxID=2056696 RepID=UPI00177BCA9B|nr:MULTISPECIES: hypothetical protein [Cysteiniphilum]
MSVAIIDKNQLLDDSAPEAKQESETISVTKDINVQLADILAEVLPNLSLSSERFAYISHALLDVLTIAVIDELNDQSIDKLKLLHQKILGLIKAKQKPGFRQSIAYARVLDLLSAGVLSRYVIRPFKVYFEKLTFINLLDEILETNFQNTSNMLENARLMLDELETLLVEEVLLQLDGVDIFKFKQVVNKLSRFFALSIVSKNESRKLFALLQSKIRPVIGYDPFIVEQVITIELNPLDENLATKPLTLVSNKYQNQTEKSQFKGLMLANYHITELDLELKRYGFDGMLKFQTSYDDGVHPDYAFLYQNVPLSMAITLENTYVFDDPDKKNTKYQTKLQLQAIASMTNDEHLRFVDPLVEQNIDKQTSEIASMLPFFTLKFSDPLKAFWSQHQPIYVDFDKSYIDVFNDNNFFQSWVQIDAAKCKKLAVKQKQMMVSAYARSFYDYFIEALDHYSVYLVYDYSKLTKGKSSYVLYDALSSDWQKKPEGKGTLTSKDLFQIDHAHCQVQPLWSKTQNMMNLADMNIDRKPLAKIYNEKQPLIKGFALDRVQFVEDVKIYTNTEQKITSDLQSTLSCVAKFQVSLRELMPFFPITPSYDLIALDKTQWQNTFVGQSTAVILSSQHFQFVQNRATIEFVKRKLTEQNYESETDKDRYEKITMIGAPAGITHFVQLQSQWLDQSAKANDLPQYQSFVTFQTQAVVTIGKDVDDSVKYAYKLYKGQSETESSFADDQGTKLTDYVYAKQSENLLSYACNLPKSLYKDPSKPAPLYVPVAGFGVTANTFNLLRNGDVVLLQFSSAETVAIKSVKLNTATIEDKASQKIAQQTLYGAQQECALSYTQDANDQQFNLKQSTKNGEGINALAFSDKQGIILSFSDEKESK